MSGPAQVRSTEAVETVAVALARFEQRVQSALDALDAELRRSAEWVEHDRPSHWKTQVHLAEDGVHEAKIELERCLTYSTSSQERPACREQKAALAKAKGRLEYCREKADAVKHWQRNFRHESFEYDGRVGQLRRLVENDVPRGRGVLAKILRTLEEYRVENAPAAFNEPGEAPAAPAAYAQPAKSSATATNPRRRQTKTAMRPSDLYTSAAHIRDAFDELQTAWQDAGMAWNDGVSRRFCETHLEPMGPVLKQALEAMTRMTHLVNEMHRVCDQ